MIIPSGVSAVNNTGNGGPRKQKLNSRNQTFSMSQEGFVLTASRSKNIKNSESNIHNPPVTKFSSSSFHDAY